MIDLNDHINPNPLSSLNPKLLDTFEFFYFLDWNYFYGHEIYVFISPSWVTGAFIMGSRYLHSIFQIGVLAQLHIYNAPFIQNLNVQEQILHRHSIQEVKSFVMEIVFSLGRFVGK